jgi:hypothetical protein
MTAEIKKIARPLPDALCFAANALPMKARAAK